MSEKYVIFSILWPFYGDFKAIIVFLAYWFRGPNFKPGSQILNGNKMVNEGCINLKSGMYKLHTYIFSTKKLFSEIILFGRDTGQNAKTDRFLAKTGKTLFWAVNLKKMKL